MPLPAVKAPLSQHKRTGRAASESTATVYAAPGLGARESHERGDELIREWLLGCSSDRMSIAVGDLAPRSMKHAEACDVKNGRPTSVVHTYRAAPGFVGRRALHGRGTDQAVTMQAFNRHGPNPAQRPET